METTAASLLGEQLRDFLVKQFAPPPGTKTTLGFLGTGIAVCPDQFQSGQGQYNPARVNRWLNLVVDPLGTITKEGDHVESPGLTASVLMDAISTGARCVAPANSDDWREF